MHNMGACASHHASRQNGMGPYVPPNREHTFPGAAMCAGLTTTNVSRDAGQRMRYACHRYSLGKTKLTTVFACYAAASCHTKCIEHAVPSATADPTPSPTLLHASRRKCLRASSPISLYMCRTETYFFNTHGLLSLVKVVPFTLGAGSMTASNHGGHMRS